MVLQDVSKLTYGSHREVLVRCDVCSIEKITQYRYYNKSIKNTGIYTCSSSCSREKVKNTCLEKYGVDNPSKLKEVRDKAKGTMLDRYGVEHAMHSPIFVDKTKNTCLEKYGVGNPSQIDSVKNKKKETNLKNLGVEYPIQNNTIREKIEKTMIEKYGVDNAMKHPDLCDLSVRKTIETRIKNNNISSNITEFIKYKRRVYHYTNKVKKKLLETWDGHDYYDNEYIKDNFNLYHMHQNYPNIDHKISVLYGFNNNIDHEVIGGIGNLCITKRKINSLKRANNFNDTFWHTTDILLYSILKNI